MDMEEGATRGDEGGWTKPAETRSQVIMDISPEEAVLWDEIVVQRGGTLD